MQKSKRLEDATKGDFLIYLKSISYFLQGKQYLAEIIMIPSGSVLEIVSIRRKKDGLCTIRVKGVDIFESPSVLLIENAQTFNYEEFIIVDKRNKSEIKLLYDS